MSGLVRDGNTLAGTFIKLGGGGCIGASFGASRLRVQGSGFRVYRAYRAYRAARA